MGLKQVSQTSSRWWSRILGKPLLKANQKLSFIVAIIVLIILVPRKSREHPTPTFPGRPLKILLNHPEDVPIWRPGDVTKWRPREVLIWHCKGRDVLGRLTQDLSRTFSRTFSGRQLEDLENKSLGHCGGSSAGCL